MLESVRISDTYGDAVYIVGGSTDVTIRGSTFERIGRQGVAVVNGRQVVVEDNEIRGVSRSVFDLEPGGRSVAQDIRLRDNRVGDYGNFLLAAGGGGPGVNDVWLEGNRVDGGNGVSVYAGVEGRRRAGYRILDNTGTGDGAAAGGHRAARADPAAQPGRGRDPGQPPGGRRGPRDLARPGVRDHRRGQRVPGGEPGAGGGGAVRRGRRPGRRTPTVAPTTAVTDGAAAPAALAPARTMTAPGTSWWPGSSGFAAGLAVAFAVFVAWRRGRDRPSA